MPFTTTPNDPLFGQAWHLRNTGQGGGTPGIDLNVLAAWGFWSGRGVLVAVADDGVEASHPDLAGRMWSRPAGATQPTDPNLLNGLPVRPGLDSAGDNHGTSVAGIIAASGNNATGSLGIAPDAQIVSYRTLNAGSASLASVFTQALADGAALVNGSFGNNTAFGADEAGLTALQAYITQGRSGLGGLFVKSNGNERDEQGAPSPADGGAETVNASRMTIAVAAVDNRGVVASYSSPGGNLLVSGFGGEGDSLLSTGQGVLTTDRAGPSNGYNNQPSPAGDYTGFNGTSAAAPTVSGVIALMLQANPGLGYRDVTEILALSARRTDPLAGTAGHDTLSRTPWLENAARTKDGGGWGFSHDYGFGLVDAGAATRLAEAWIWAPRTEANLVSATAAFTGSGSVTSGAAWSTSLTIGQPTDAQTGFRLNRVELTLDLTAARPSDLTVTLLSPGGTSIRLLTTTGNAFVEENGGVNYNTPDPLPGGAAILLGSPGFWGEHGTGNWTLTVSTIGQGATVNEVGLEVFGDSRWADAAKREAAEDLSKVAVYTDGFAAAVAADAARAQLARNGETVLNLAAMTAAAVLDLTDGAAATNRLGATAVSLAAGNAVRTVLGGAGDDVFIGTANGDTLAGGWGDDILIGFGGRDILRGGAGNDILIGNGIADSLEGGAGRDAAIFAVTRAEAFIQRLDGGLVRVNSTAEGPDDLRSVELLVFADGLVNIGPLRARDFTGDGHADLLLRNATGALSILPMQGDAVRGRLDLPVVDPAARLEVTGDQNGDGFADMSFRKDNGGWIFAYGQGDEAPVLVDLGTLDTSWSVFGMPDLDGDGMGDPLLLNANGFLAAMPSAAGGAAILTHAPGVTAPNDPGGQFVGLAAGWSLLGAADMTGEGKADLLLRTDAGQLLLLVMDGTLTRAAELLPFGLQGATLVGLGDLNADGRADIVTRDDATGEVTARLMHRITVTASATLQGPQDYTAFAMEDYSGDDRTDILWQRADGGLLLWEMAGTSLAWSGMVAAPEAGWTLVA